MRGVATRGTRRHASLQIPFRRLEARTATGNSGRFPRRDRDQSDRAAFLGDELIWIIAKVHPSLP